MFPPLQETVRPEFPKPPGCLLLTQALAGGFQQEQRLIGRNGVDWTAA